MENKKKVIIHINNISVEVKEALHAKYPDGYQNFIFKVTKPNNEFFHAITVDTEQASYLIKVDVKIDNATEEKLAEQLFVKDDNPDSDIKDTDDESETPLKTDDDVAEDI